MRTRGIYPFLAIAIVAIGLLLAASSGPASARLQTDATPEGTPVDSGTPVAEEPAAPDSGIVTMVLWYQQNEEGDILQLSPVSVDGFVTTKGTIVTDADGGRVVFEEPRNEGYPRIRLGEEDYFDAFPIYPDDPASVQRWFYYNDDATIRPATMVMQIVGIRGQYEDWFGTATFISRGTDQGGIMIIAINPPE
jgi:hypothetical protein